MESTKQNLASLIERVKISIPEGADLKGFPGISKELIVNILEQSLALLIPLTEHNNDFETILLKRDLAELFDKISDDLSESFEKMKPNAFNSFLKKLSRIKFLIKETLLSIIERSPIRTEVEISKAKEDLSAVSANIEELKKIYKEAIALDSEVKKNITAAGTAIDSLRITVIENINGFQTEVSSLKEKSLPIINASVEEINKIKESSSTVFLDIEAKQKKSLDGELKVEALITKIEADKVAIESINKNTTAWEVQIKKANEEIATNSVGYDVLVKKFKESQNEIEEAKQKILGVKKENGDIVKGFLGETQDLKNDLTTFYSDQEKKYTAQYSQIEGLLPGATTAGLAEAFEKQKNSYSRQILFWSIVFICITVVMTLFALDLLFPTLFNSKASAPVFAQTWEQALMSLLKDLPFFIPTIWLAVFASKQQSQFKRLQQEYAFKETNAKSFYGYKKQIEELGNAGEAEKNLMFRLIGQLVIITSQNPSYTLDNKSHEDGPFLMKMLEKMIPGKKKDSSTEKAPEPIDTHE
jgi:hypothetical protein